GLFPFERVTIEPPAQRPHPPIYVAGYTDETIGFALERGLPLLLSLEPPEGRQLTACESICGLRGQPYDPSAFSLTRYVCIGRDAAEADRLVDDLLPRLHMRRKYFAVQRGSDPDALEVR